MAVDLIAKRARKSKREKFDLPDQIQPGYYTADMVDRIAPDGGLQLAGQRLQILENRQYVVKRHWFDCPFCKKGVDVEVYIVPGGVVDMDGWHGDVRDKANPRFDEIKWGEMWCWADEIRGAVHKNCECNWK